MKTKTKIAKKINNNVTEALSVDFSFFELIRFFSKNFILIALISIVIMVPLSMKYSDTKLSRTFANVQFPYQVFNSSSPTFNNIFYTINRSMMDFSPKHKFSGFEIMANQYTIRVDLGLDTEDRALKKMRHLEKELDLLEKEVLIRINNNQKIVLDNFNPRNSDLWGTEIFHIENFNQILKLYNDKVYQVTYVKQSRYETTPFFWIKIYCMSLVTSFFILFFIQLFRKNFKTYK